MHHHAKLFKSNFFNQYKYETDSDLERYTRPRTERLERWWKPTSSL